MSEFNEFEPWLKTAKNRFLLSTGLNLEKLNDVAQILQIRPQFSFSIQHEQSHFYDSNIQYSQQDDLWEIFMSLNNSKGFYQVIFY